MSKRIDTLFYKCCRCGNTGREVGSCTHENNVMVRFALPRGWTYVDVELCAANGPLPPSHQLSFVCWRCSLENARTERQSSDIGKGSSGYAA